MTTGLGFSIGSVNSVSAMVTGERPWSSVRTRRTAVTFDSVGGIRIGGIPQFDMAVTEFADLARDPESVIVGGRLWSPANLVAAVVNGLLESFPSTTGAVATYPACYSDKQLSLLRQALNLAGATEVLLIPEPVAAAEWLEHERGPLESGFVLVYDLGGASLDVSMVRVGPDWDDHPIVGKSVRSYDFGGRPLGSMIARYARVAEPGDNGSMLQMTSMVDIASMRAQHIRDSLDVVHECVASTGRSLSDIACVLLVGGASRPAEVARILAELGRPVVMSTDPGQTIAVGAAGYAARRFAPMSTGGRHRAPKVAVFSSAAVASAVAVSAVTVFGGPSVPARPSLVDALPEGFPIDNQLFEPNVAARADAGSAAVGRASTAAGFGYSGRATYGIAPAAYTTPIGPSVGPSVAEAHGGSHSEPRSRTTHFGGGTYADPARFLNPLPFSYSPKPIPAAPKPAVVKPIPSISLPGSVPAPANPSPTAPGSTATNPGAATPATGGTSGVGGVPGTTTDGTSTGAGTSGGTASSGSTGGASSGASSGTGGSASEGSSGGAEGSTSGGSTSTGTSVGSTGGSTSDGSASGGASGGSTSGGVSGSTGGGASGGSTNGGVSGSTGGGVSGGSASGGASGGSTSTGTSAGGSTSDGSMSGGASDGSPGGGASGGATSSGASGSTGGGASGGSTNGGVSGSTSGGASGGPMGGGASGGSTSGGASEGSTSGGSSGGSTSGGMSGGSTSGTSGGSTSPGSIGGASAGGKSSGGTTSGGASHGGGSAHGSGGSGGGGGARR